LVPIAKDPMVNIWEVVAFLHRYSAGKACRRLSSRIRAIMDPGRDFFLNEKTDLKQSFQYYL
jgi:hypothetical protein